MKVKMWLDSGANIHSKHEVEVSLDEFDYTEAEFKELPDDEQFDLVLDYMYGFDWGITFTEEDE